VENRHYPRSRIAELSNIATKKQFAAVIATFRRRVSEVWDLSVLNHKVRLSQSNRIIVREALKKGQLVNWDFIPNSGYSDLYVRSSNSHEVIDRKVRIKGEGTPASLKPLINCTNFRL
jgi:hypothetical protein|tara:strand:+ start:6483 stop:6836 length:354 start_codon:yes stop_codon:yes gene_type:complete